VQRIDGAQVIILANNCSKENQIREVPQSSQSTKSITNS